MIVFLTLIYVLILSLLVKFKVLQLNLFWKLSPILWMLILFIFLFVPLQWGAPAGNVRVYQTVVEVIPNVAGEVIEVPVQGMQPLKKDDVLFRIDPEPYQFQLDAARSALEDAKQKVEQLKAAADSADAAVEKTLQGIDLMKAEEQNALANIVAAEATVEEALAKKKRANSLVADLKFQVETAERELSRLQGLQANNAISASQVDKAQIQVTGLQSQLATATIDAEAIEQTITKSRANLDVAKTNAHVLELRLKQQLQAELPRVKFNAKQARLAAESRIGDKPTIVASAEAALKTAEYNLAETTVRAPANGYAIGVTLRPGQRVANLPLRAWMTFVNDEKTEIAVGVKQYAMRYVEVGQPAEVTFKFYPGKVFRATVDRIASVNAQGQLVASGNVPTAPGTSQMAAEFGVILKLEDDSDIDVSRLPGGAIAKAAIYTDKAKVAHIIRKVMIRMQAWQNYVIP